MWALIYKEFVQLRNYLLQLGLVIVVAIALFGNSLEGFILPYLGIMPVVMALTLPQMLFGMEERGNTLVFLRSLPVRPRQIVAGKFVVSSLVVGALLLFQLGYASFVGKLGAALSNAGPNLIAAAFLLGISMFLHFRLGSNSAKIALLVSLMAFALLGMAAMQNKQLLSTVTTFVQQLVSLFSPWMGAVIGLAIALVILLLFYTASASVFTRQDVSRMP